jgi:SAM-dependent methyltransferase
VWKVPDVRTDLADHPDRRRWNARYADDFAASFAAHPLMAMALSQPLPDGPVLDLASGPSGSALLAAAAGRRVTAVDVSDTALRLLAEEASRRGMMTLISLVHADLAAWRPQPGSYAVVLCTGYWDRNLFPAAADAVAADGVLGWEAFTADARLVRPSLPEAWVLGAGEPASLLPGAFETLSQQELPDDQAGAKRRLLAHRVPGPAATPSVAMAPSRYGGNHSLDHTTGRKSCG